MTNIPPIGIRDRILPTQVFQFGAAGQHDHFRKGLAGSCNRVEMAREAFCRVTTISCHVPGPTLSFRPANRGSLSQQNTIEYHCLGDATVRIQRRNGSSSRAAWYPTSVMFIRHGRR